MTDTEEIRQIILYKNGNIENNTKFDIDILNDKIIAISKIKQVRESIKEDDRLYQNSELNLSKDSIEKHYKQIMAYHKADNKEWNSLQERTKEDWKLCNHFQNNIKHKNKKIEVSNFGRVKVDGAIIVQDDISKDKGELYIKEFGTTLKVWTLVAKTWLGELPKDGYIYDVHHITNNGHDNRPENLIWLKRYQHIKVKHKTRA